MKNLVAMFFLFSISVANAAQFYPLFPGQSLTLGDGSQVVCQSGALPPPPVNTAPPCVVKFNPSNNQCNQYIVFDPNGEAASPCLYNLGDVEKQLRELAEVGTCSRPNPTPCVVKFNPSNNQCNQYVIFGSDNSPLTSCLMNMDQAVEPTLNKLKDLGICSR